MNLDTHELAWAAGFFDGEGSFYVSDDKRGKGFKIICLSITQAEENELFPPETLDRFESIIPNGNITGPYARGRSHYKKQYTYKISGFQSVQFAYCLMFPNLGTLKREQGAEALTVYKEYWIGKHVHNV